MIGKKYLIISLGILSVLLGSLFYYNMARAQEIGEYDPWIDINDDGKIDGQDLFYPSRAFGTYGTPINKTALLLELLERVEVLENQTIPEGYIGPPAYDSGWITIPVGQWVPLEHNLNTTELFVYVLGKSQVNGTNQVGLNQRYPYQYSVRWTYNSKNISLFKGEQATLWWDYVRVMIWKIQEP